jgi:hypothetical protein
MSLQKSTAVIANSDTAANILSKCSALGVGKLIVRLTTAECSDPTTITWLRALQAGSPKLFAAAPFGNHTWAQSANHATALAHMDAACGILTTGGVRLFDGYLEDSRPWLMGSTPYIAALGDWRTLNHALYTRATTFTAPWNPSGSASLDMEQSIRWDSLDLTMTVGSLERNVNRELKGHSRLILVGSRDRDITTNRIAAGFNCAKPASSGTGMHHDISIGLYSSAVGQPDVSSSLETFNGQTKASLAAYIATLQTFYSNSPLNDSVAFEDKAKYVFVDNLQTWDALA